MKKLIGLVAKASPAVFSLAVFVVMALLLAGCSGEAKTTSNIQPVQTQPQFEKYGYVKQAQTVVSEGDILMDVAGRTQEFQLKVDGKSIMGLQGVGTKQYGIENVVNVMYISNRNFFQTMPSIDAKTGRLVLLFGGAVNNDYPSVVFFMDDGEQYQVETRALTFRSTEPIQFLAREYGFQYGHEEKTYVDVVKNSDDTITFYVFFGCDKLVWLQEDVDADSMGGVAWELENKSLYVGSLEKNSYGSYYAAVTAPLVQAIPTMFYGEGPSTTGQLVIFSKNGSRVPFGTRETGADWEYYTDYDILSWDRPYWNVEGKKGIMRFYQR